MPQRTDCRVFGPVPSRRLGRSVGLNNLPSKLCTYSCVYCQVGRTRRLTSTPAYYFEPESLCAEVRDLLEKLAKAGQEVDYLTVVPNGEPTLDLGLGRLLELLRTTGRPIGVITNGSLLWRDEVRARLSAADWVSVKIDTVAEEVWRRLDRPHGRLELERVLAGIAAFASTFVGHLATETMLVEGLNDSVEEAERTAGFIGKIGPSQVWLSVPTRPPAEPWVRPPASDRLDLIRRIFMERVGRVCCLDFPEQGPFGAARDLQADLLAITAVHPMRMGEALRLLADLPEPMALVDDLINRGDLEIVAFEGERFLRRRLVRWRDSAP